MKWKRWVERVAPYLRAGFWVAVALWISADFHRAAVKSAGRFALPIDDAYIYLRYGQHLFSDGPYRYGPGEPVTSGSTSLLYPWVPGVLHLFGVPPARLPGWLFWLSAIFLGVMAHLAYELTRVLVRPPGKTRPDTEGAQGARAGPPWLETLDALLKPARPYLPEDPAGHLAGLVTAVSLLCAPYVVWGVLIGMEGGIYGCVLLGSLLLWARARTGPALGPPSEPSTEKKGLRRWFDLDAVPGRTRVSAVLLVVLAGLLPVCRPEGLLVAGPLAVLSVASARPGLKLRALPLWALAFMPWLAAVMFHWGLTGHLGPNTAVAKSVLHEPLSDFGRQTSMMWHILKDLFDRMIGDSRVAKPMFHWTRLTVGFALLGLAATCHEVVSAVWTRVTRGPRRNGPGNDEHEPIASRHTLALSALGFATVGTLAGLVQNRVFYFDHNRYALGVLVTGIVLACVMFGRVAVRLRLAWILPLAALTVAYAAKDPRKAIKKEYARGARDMVVFQISTARYIRHHLPGKKTLLGVNDAGAIPFYSGMRVFDIVGLTTNGMAAPFRHGNGSLYEALENLKPERRPTHFAVFPRYLRSTGLVGRILFRPRARRMAGAARNINALFKARWEIAASGHGLPPPSVWADAKATARLRDRVDVADLQSEAAHHYRNPRPDLKWYAWRVNYSLVRHERSSSTTGPRSPAPLTDGGRPVTLSETMRVKGCAAARCVWVARVAAFRSTVVDVVWNNKVRGKVRIQAGPGFRLIHHEITTKSAKPGWLTIRVQRPHRKKPAYVSYHHWIAEVGGNYPQKQAP